MAQICKDMEQITETIDEYLTFLGPELKAVTGKLNFLKIYNLSLSLFRNTTIHSCISDCSSLQWLRQFSRDRRYHQLHQRYGRSDRELCL